MKRHIVAEKEPTNILLQTLLVIVCVSLLVSFIYSTLSWFAGKDSGEEEVVMGQVVVQVESTYPDPKVPLVPNNTYSGTTKIVNTNVFDHIAMFVRVKVSTSSSFIMPNIAYYNGDTLSWIAQDTADGTYYYYVGALDVNEESTLITSYSTGSINGEVVDTTGSKIDAVSIHIEAEAVQDNWTACLELWGEENLPSNWVQAMQDLGYGA